MERTLDGSELGIISSCGMGCTSPIRGERILRTADRFMSRCLHGLTSLPFSFKSSALAVVFGDGDGDVDRFREAVFTSKQASSMLLPYIKAVAAALQENNVKVAVHDGTSIRADLSSSSFAFVAETVFNQLQCSGIVRSTQLRHAVSLFVFEEIGTEASYTVKAFIRRCEPKLDLDAFVAVSRRILSAIAADLEDHPVATLV